VLYLADTSAWTRSAADESIALRWAELLAGRELAVCSPLQLELLYSADSPADYTLRRSELEGLVQLRLGPEVEETALGTQPALEARSQHRGPRPIDLIIAAVAQVYDAVLLHYDKHFDAIAGVTGQPAEWLAKPGSLD
jgi:predicted nucleic acid-binding protein